MILNIQTPSGKRYHVNYKREIYKVGDTPSGGWLLLGFSHVKRSDVIPFKFITPELLKGFIFCWKNGNPQWTVQDLDHGTVRQWGNTKYHGIAKAWFTKD